LIIYRSLLFQNVTDRETELQHGKDWNVALLFFCKKNVGIGSKKTLLFTQAHTLWIVTRVLRRPSPLAYAGGQAGPPLSQCNRCRCIGPHAMVFGHIVHFYQILLALRVLSKRLIKFYC